MSHEITPIAKGTSTISRIIEKIWGKVRINTFLLPCQLPLPPPPCKTRAERGAPPQLHVGEVEASNQLH